MKDKLKAKFAKKVEEFDEVDNDNDVDQEDIPVEEMAVSQKVLDLVAVTLRPKTTKDGTAKENTYGEHYNELKSIMDEYIEEDDYSTSSSVTMELKPKDSNSRKFLYTVYAVLADYAGKPYEDKEDVLRREKDSEQIFSTDVKFSGEDDRFKVAEGKEDFASLLTELKTIWEDIENKQQIVKEERLIKFLKQFTTPNDKSTLRQMFSFLCSDTKINISGDKCKKYFNNLESLQNKKTEK